MQSRSIAMASLIAAMYAILTFIVTPIAFGPVQFRLGEILTVLPLFTSIAVPGLAVGCLLANLIGLFMGQTMAWDLLFGTLATLLAAGLTYWIGRVMQKNRTARYLLGPLAPVLINALVVGLEISWFFSNGEASFAVFIWQAISVGIGEIVVCYVLGVPLAWILEQSGVAEKIFS